MTGIFITATGTDIGKTVVSEIIARQRHAKKLPILCLKPVISGFTSENINDSDSAILIKAMGKSVTPEMLDYVSPFRFKAPLAPNMAALAEGKTVDSAAIITHCKEAIVDHKFTLVEGVGGSHVPLDDTMLVVDWINALALPTLLVIGNYLGTLSHTLASIEAMQHRGIIIKGIIINESEKPTEGKNPDMEETKKTLEQHLNLDCPIVTLPRPIDPKNLGQCPDLLKPFGLDQA